MSFKRLDVSAYLPGVETTTPAKVAKVAKVDGGASAKPTKPPFGIRSFLSRPLGQEDNLDPWDAWAPFLDWLLIHYPDRLRIILDAEEDIRALESNGIVKGAEYEAACSELLWYFEEARRLKLRESIKVWVQ
jgi:hypothetical protein